MVASSGSAATSKDLAVAAPVALHVESAEEADVDLSMEGDFSADEKADDGDAVAQAGLGRRSLLERRKAERSALPPTQLTSVKELLQGRKQQHYMRVTVFHTQATDVEDRSRPGLTTSFQKHVYVGLIDEALSIIQHNTRLLVVNHSRLG